MMGEQAGAMKPLCIYHANCADGFGAAWVVRRFFGDGNVDFHPGVYGAAPPDVSGRDVIMVDFCYKRPVLEEMGERAASIIILDHHKTAAADLSSYAVADIGAALQDTAIAAIFDMDRSGARLAWDCFFPDQEPPALIKHIEDRDLWRFKLPGTREIQAAVSSYPYEFEVWDGLMADDPQNLVAEGSAIERKHFKDIHEFIETTRHRLTVGGHDVPALNAPYFWSSDAGHILARGEPFAACYWHAADGVVFSLRSSDDGEDVSEIAKLYGGGGHRNASGFKVENLAALMPGMTGRFSKPE